MKFFQKRNASPLLFQLALVLSLLLVYIALESKTPIYADKMGYPVIPNDFDDDLDIPEYTPEEPKPDKPVKVPPELPPIDKNNLIENDNPNETIFSTSNVDEPVKPRTDIDFDFPPEMDPKDYEDERTYRMMDVQEIPLFPGCKGNNEERIKCLSDNIGKIIARNFDPEIAQNIGLSPGNKRIFVKFLINKSGEIEILETNAPHKALEKETTRVLGKIPNITPAKMNGKNVKSTFIQKINYRVMDN